MLLGGRGDTQFTVWVFLIDLFLFVAGTLIVCGFLVMGATVTQRMDDLVIDCIDCMGTKHIPVYYAAASYTYLMTGGRKTGMGFKIFGSRLEWSHLTAFISLKATVM